MVLDISEIRTAWQDSDFITDCLCWHNVYRQRHNSPPLSMLPELCHLAQTWANHLAHTNRFYYRNDRDIGQNLFCRTTNGIVTDVSGQEVTTYWYSAVKQYDFSNEPYRLRANVNAGHFTQLVWANSRHLGVGKARSRSGKVVVVAHYAPAGNISGAYLENVFPPCEDLPRFPENEIKILLAVIYLPVGLTLLLLRCILVLFLFIFGQILPDSPVVQSFLNNLACLCFGITVSVENSKKKENVDVYISNSLSVLDNIAINKAIGFVLPLNKTPLQSLLGLGISDVGNINNPDTFKRKLDMIKKDKKIPILCFPEETSTNGRALLKFSNKYFQFFEKVQPLYVMLKRPLLDISVSTIGSTNINDILYFMYSPFTNYTIKFLPSMEKKSLSEEEYAEIVRQNIASELKVEACPFSSSDLAEWSKRRLAEEKRRNQERTASQLGSVRYPNPELTRMASQVKEVLPHVPVVAIYNDLVVTRSIDTTITNILEGRVRFVPEPLTVTPVASTSSSSPSSQPSTSSSQIKGTGSTSSGPPPSHLNTGASSFGKSATERTKSFQERKEQLIAAARRRYIEKHNLNIPV